MRNSLSKIEKDYLYRVANYNGKNRYVKLKAAVYNSNVNHLNKFSYYDKKIFLTEDDIINAKYHLKVMEKQKNENRLLRHSELKNIFDKLKN